MATARDRSAAMMRRFLDGGDVAYASTATKMMRMMTTTFFISTCVSSLNNDDHVAHFAAAQVAPVPPNKKIQVPSQGSRGLLMVVGLLGKCPTCRPCTSFPMEDWQEYFANKISMYYHSGCFKTWCSLPWIGGGPHDGMRTMSVGLRNRCLIWNSKCWVPYMLWQTVRLSLWSVDSPT